MIHTGTAASTGPVTASNTSSEADVPTSSILQQSEAIQRLDGDTSNASRPEDSSQNDSLVTDSVMSQEMASLASAALPSSPVTSIPNSDDIQPTVSSHLEPTVSEMLSSSMPYQQKDHQLQPMVSNPGISVSKQTMQHPQFTTPGVQTQHFDADGKSGIKKSVATSQQYVEQQQQQSDQAQQGGLNITQHELQQQRQGQEYVVQQVSLDKQKKVIWSGVMELKIEAYGPVSVNIIASLVPTDFN